MAINRQFSFSKKAPIFIEGRMIFLIYRSIPGLERFEITVTGSIYDTFTHKFIQQHLTRQEYPYRGISISDGNYLVHRLVAQTYIPNPYNLPEVNHIDGDTLNNWVNNLEWCTRAYNIKDRVFRKKYGIGWKMFINNG
jgi:HNH endonuclease